jgi:TetR/AcrR family transcriptional regulator, tetracycline repressor protein
MTQRSDSSLGTNTPNLTRDAVAAATLDLIDQSGLHAATMRSIAFRLGVKAQSLYTHIENREDLLDAVADRIVKDIDTDPDMHRAFTDPWELHLAGAARGVRRYARRHASAFVLVATRPAHPLRSEPRLLSHRWVTNFLAVLHGGGFSDDDITFAYRAFDSFLLGSLLLETRDLVVEAAAAPGGCLRADPAPVPTTAEQHRRPGSLGHEHDDNFVADLTDLIHRITVKARRTPSEPNTPFLP